MIQKFDNADETRKSIIIDPAQAARDSLQAFISVQYPDYQTNWHIRKIAIALKKVMRGEIKRLIIEAPPRHSKSLHVSQYFPPWYMGHNPTHEVMFVTYAQQFANKWGRKVRNIIASPEYRDIFDTRLAGDSKAAHEFALVHGGEYHALGIDGQATGKGANLAIIDDPYKNRKQAESYKYREMVREFFNSALYTRLSPGGAIVVMMTRWHENDLINTLLEEDEFKADGWHVLKFPAVNESETEALWPSRYDLDRLMQIKKKIGLYNWNSLYLQRPSAREGNMFKRTWWRYYMRLPPKFDKVVQSWDFAFKDKKKTNTEKGSDFVVGQVWGKIGPDLYLIAQFRQQVDILRGAQALLKMTKDFPLSRIKLIEDKANGPATMQLLNKTIGGMVPVNPCKSKEERADALKYLPEGGNVYLPHKSIASWIDSEFIDEWSVFPNGKHDDTVDAGTQAWEYLEGRETNRLEKLLKM